MLIVFFIFFNQDILAERLAQPCPVGTNCLVESSKSEILERESCWRQHILAAAKRKIAKDFNRDRSNGFCAAALQASLGEAGVLDVKWPKPEEPFKGNLGYWYGDAIDFHDRGPTFRQTGKNLEPGHGILWDLGFRNIIAQHPDPYQCLPGTVLVFQGFDSYNDFYQKNGKLDPKHPRPIGDSVGHVTICGDERDNTGKIRAFYTDGKTRDPALPGRKLVGVYTLSDCIKCHSAYKKICQNISRREEYE